MIAPKNFYKIFFVINDLSETVLRKIDDYKKNLINNNNLKKKFHNIEFVYMHSIILDLAKIISVTGADKSGLKQLKRLCFDMIILDEINNFEIKHKETIKKIKANRDRIIAHVDISDVKYYADMGFSRIEIENKLNDQKKYLEHYNIELNQDMINKLEKLTASSSEDERYSPSDFISEMETLEIMIKEIQKISSDLNIYFYNSLEWSK